MNSIINNNNITKSFAWKFSEVFLSQGVKFLIQILLARILCPEDFAVVAILMAIISFADIFVNSGISTAIIQKKELEKEDISTIFTFSLSIAMLMYGVLYISAPWFQLFFNMDSLIWPMRVLSFVIILNSINSIQTAMYQRNMDFRLLFFRNLLSIPLSGVVALCMAIKGYGVWALVAHTICNVLFSIIVMSISNKYPIYLGFSLARWKNVWSFSSKILAGSLLNKVYNNSRTFFIGKLYTPLDLAFFDKAYLYTNFLVQVATTSVSAVLLPVLSRKQDNICDVKSTLRKSVRITIFFLFPTLFLLAALSEPFVRIVLTEKWIGSVIYFKIFCILYLPSCFIQIDKQALYSVGKSGCCLIYECANCLLNIVVLLCVIDRGVLNIAVSAMFVEVISAIFMIHLSKSVFGYTYNERFGDILKPLTGSIIMFIFLTVLQVKILITIYTIIPVFCLGILLYWNCEVLLRNDVVDTVSFILKSKIITRRS